jgi:hypothetical protein
MIQHWFLHKLKIGLICGIGLYASGFAQAQSAILENYIQEGLQANLQLKQQGLDIARQQEALRQSKSLGMPKLTFDANYTLAAGGRRIDFPIGDLLNDVYGNLNALNAVPGNLPPGVIPGVFPALENQQIQFLPNNFHETKVSFAYPVFNSDLKYNRQIQQHLLDSKTAEKAAGTPALCLQNYADLMKAWSKTMWQRATS